MLVTGKVLLDMANRENFAIPAYNISSGSMFNAVLRACEQDQAPWIVAIHPAELAHIGTAAVAGFIAAANSTKLPMAVHLDHGATFEQVMIAMHHGFTSVMLDASALPFDDNVASVSKVVEAAHDAGVSVEGELGTIGQMEYQSKDGNKTIMFTKPADARRFVESTGCDSLAVAIGTSHGLYPAGMKPKLDLDLLGEIKRAVGIPLVMHGGSGNPDSEVSDACARGINKVNISSDIKHAFYTTMRTVLSDPALREPNEIEPPCEEALIEVVHTKNALFSAIGRARLYR
ncbi:MAG: ketose-bisphosphate aldolase [Propionibacteriaceae bacterium]|nr:ketose-bisphosphate aldolase [Propionibacteriaceae bacterium]